jgi:transposase
VKTADFRSLSPDAQEIIRKRTVQDVLDGKSQTAAATENGVTRQAVNGWMKLYQEKGSTSLKAKPRGRPIGKGRLLPWQAGNIVRAIEGRCPDQLQLPFYLWTRQAVAELIQRKYNIQLSVWTVGRLLKRWGFTPQKPTRRAYEQDPKVVARWLEKEYPTIVRLAKAKKAMILWGDEMGVRSDHQTGTTYGRRGQTPVIPGTGQRFRCNMVSAISNRGKMAFMVFRGSFNGKVFLCFLRRLLRQIPGSIILIVDSLPAHKGKSIRQWLKDNSQRIQMFFLPAYSPELNPDEMLNQDVKTNAVGRKRPSSQKEMIKNVRGYLWSRQRKPEVVKNYFHKKSVKYAAL